MPSTCTAILECLRSLGRGGLPERDAKQLFLWMFCVVDVLPETRRMTPPSHEDLEWIFATLSAEGVVASVSGPTDWDRLVREFLLKKVELDNGFLDKAKEYLRGA